MEQSSVTHLSVGQMFDWNGKKIRIEDFYWSEDGYMTVFALEPVVIDGEPVIIDGEPVEVDFEMLAHFFVAESRQLS
jgi:hypothetical protein